MAGIRIGLGIGWMCIVAAEMIMRYTVVVSAYYILTIMRTMRGLTSTCSQEWS